MVNKLDVQITRINLRKLQNVMQCHVCVCACVHVCGSGSLHCMNEIVTLLNLTLSLLYMANCNVLSI